MMTTFRNWNDVAGTFSRVGESGMLDYFKLAANIADDHHVLTAAVAPDCRCFRVGVQMQGFTSLPRVHDNYSLEALTSRPTILSLSYTEQPP
jgi:hypothetical protein